MQSSEATHVILTIVAYFVVPCIVAAFFLELKKQGQRTWWSYFVFSFVAVLLAPLVLKVIGNEILDKYVGSLVHSDLSVIAYLTLIAIGGVPLIRKMVAAYLDKDVAADLRARVANVEDAALKQGGFSAPPAEAVTDGTKTVVVVEDDAINREKMVRLLNLVSSTANVADIPLDLHTTKEQALRYRYAQLATDSGVALTSLGRIYLSKYE